MSQPKENADQNYSFLDNPSVIAGRMSGDDAKSIPREQLVEELVKHCITFQDGRPSDMRRHENDLPDTQREGCIDTDPDKFSVATALVLEQQEVTRETNIFLSELAKLIISSATDNHVHSDKVLDNLNTNLGRNISNVRQGYSITNSSHTYFDINCKTNENAPTAQIIANQVKDIVDAIKNKYREGILKVLENSQKISEFISTAEVATKINRTVQLVEQIKRWDALRENVESGTDRIQFLKIMQDAVDILGKQASVGTIPIYSRFIKEQEDIKYMKTFLITKGNVKAEEIRELLLGMTSHELYNHIVIDILQNKVRELGREEQLTEKMTEDRHAEKSLEKAFVKDLAIFGWEKGELEVELLDTRDALLMMCEGVYVHKSNNKKSKVAIPMSDYGTNNLKSLDEVFQILAHEVAHHQLREIKKIKETEDHMSHNSVHDLSHNILMQKNLKILRSLDLKFKGHEGGITL